MAKKEENLIHLRFDYSEAKIAKRDILSSEISLLKIAQAMKNYQDLRNQELKTKEKIALKINSAKSDLAKLHRILPKLKIPKILDPEEKSLKKNKTELKKEIEIAKYGTLEDQLRDIQKRLKILTPEE